MKINPKTAYEVVRDSIYRFIADDCFSMAGSLAYYTIFSLPALLVIMITSAGFFLTDAEARTEIEQQVLNLVGPQASEQVRVIITHATENRSQSGVTALIGIGTLLFGATGAFVQLQNAMNKVWHVKPDPKQGGVKNFIQKRLLSFGMVLGVGFLLLVSLTISAAMAAFGKLIAQWLSDGAYSALLHGLNAVVSYAVITVLFAAIFKVMPDVKIRWADVWLGAAVTSLLFGLGKLGIGYYLGKSDIGSAYGAAGSLAIILVWIYYSSVILLAGAEFTQVWYCSHGHKARPEPGAVRVKEAVKIVRSKADGNTREQIAQEAGEAKEEAETKS